VAVATVAAVAGLRTYGVTVAAHGLAVENCLGRHCVVLQDFEGENDLQALKDLDGNPREHSKIAELATLGIEVAMAWCCLECGRGSRIFEMRPLMTSRQQRQSPHELI
jgi:hypothetical protein